MERKITLKLQDEVLNALQESGYDLITAMEFWNKFKKELHTYSDGKHTLQAGNFKIHFTIKRG